MAITEVEVLNDGGGAAVNTFDVDFTSQPASGTLWIAAGACAYPSTTGQISFGAPSDLTLQESLDAGGSIGALCSTKDSSGSDGKTTTFDKSSTAEWISLVAINLSNTNGYDTSGKAFTNSGTSLACSTDENVTDNDSLAYAIVFMEDDSYTASMSGWTLVSEHEDPGADGMVAFVYKKTVNSGALSGTFQLDTGSARRIRMFIVVAGPGNDDPVLMVPGAQRYVRGKAHVISGVSAVDADNDESVVTLTCNKGTFAAPTPTNVDVSGENTASMTLTGTTTELNAYFAAGNGPTYTHSSANHDADTITINWDDQVGTADEETIAVTCVDFLLNAPDIATFNTVLGTLTYEEGTAKTVSLTVGAEDDGGRTDTEVSTITVADVMAQLNLAIQLFKRRRKWI